MDIFGNPCGKIKDKPGTRCECGGTSRHTIYKRRKSSTARQTDSSAPPIVDLKGPFAVNPFARLKKRKQTRKRKPKKRKPTKKRRN